MDSLSHLVLIAGYSGSGKTFVAFSLARLITASVYLDKDTLTSPLAEELLKALGQPIADRESSVYQEKVRPFEYECLMTVAFENLESGKSVIASAPFLREFSDRQWTKNVESHAKERGFRLHFVWVKSDPEVMKENLLDRGAYRDTYKLQHWDEYAKTLKTAVPERIPHGTIIFDNTSEATDSFSVRIEKLAEHIGFLR